MVRISALPGMAPPQPRRARRERRELYEAVVHLRRRGNRIHRAGREHSLVNGRRVPNAEIERLAARFTEAGDER